MWSLIQNGPIYLSAVRSPLVRLVAVLLSSIPAVSEGTIYATLRIESEPIIYDGCVLFAQGIGSLTKIDLATGDVLLRKAPKDLPYGGELRRHPLGVVMVDYGDVALLDSESFDVVWSVEDAWDAAIGKDHFLVSDGNQTVTCHRLTDGAPVWSIDMNGGWRLSAHGDVGVISTPEIYDERHALKAIRLSSGQELFSISAEDDERFIDVYLVGETVYVLTCNSGRPPIDSPPPDALVELGPEGRRIRTIDYASTEIVSERGDKRRRSGFFFEDRYFPGWEGPRSVFEYEPDEVVDAWKADDIYPEPLKSGLLLERTVSDSSGDRHTVLEFFGKRGRWATYPTQLQGMGITGRVAEGEDCLVISSMDGHVECLELKTGEPRWIYVFPLIRKGKTYYSGVSQTIADAVTEPALGPSRPESVRGSIPLPVDFDSRMARFEQTIRSRTYSGRVVFDPSPDNPRHWVPTALVVIATGLAVTPAAVLITAYGALRFIRWRGQTEPSRPRGGLLARDWWILSRTAEVLLFVSICGAVMTFGIPKPVPAAQVLTILLCLFVAAFSSLKSWAIQRSLASPQPTGHTTVGGADD